MASLCPQIIVVFGHHKLWRPNAANINQGSCHILDNNGHLVTILMTCFPSTERRSAKADTNIT